MRTGARLDAHGNFPGGYLEMVEANGGWWMTTLGGLEGLFVRNAYGKIEAIALHVRQVRYDKRADFPTEISAIVGRELTKAPDKALDDTFGE